MKLYNTLTKKKEEFVPEDKNNVRMYVCGPTVYDRAHIGNARAVVVFDALYRSLRHVYGDQHVTYVRNITDVDDKINKKAEESGLSIRDITDKTIKQFHDDMAALGCINPNMEPRATEHISEMIDMIERLIANGHAYEAEGHVLFDVTSDPDYGHLSRRSRDEMIAGARVEIAPYKRNAGDFVLWKPSDSTKGEPGWDSPWGYGRPGWHIECSAMSTKYLGATFDIHGGGADLQFPHHENEIAQSNCANKDGKFANYWVHNGFLTVDGEKMSKSLGNFTTVHDLLDQGVKGEVIRLALLSTHYRKPLDWTQKAVSDAEKTLKRYFSVISQRANATDKVDVEFIEALSDDLNTPKAIALMHGYAAKNDGDQLYMAGKLLGLFYSDVNLFNDSNQKAVAQDAEKIEALIAARLEARKNKNWQEADRIRDEIAAMGITLKDNPDGTTSWE